MATWFAGVTSILAPAVASAHYIWNFPTPVTPIATETLYVHDIFLAIIVTIFILVLSAFLYSIFHHRKSRGYIPATFTKPKTPMGWVLVALPFLTLTFIDYVVLGIPAYHSVLALANTRSGSKMVVRITGSQWAWHYDYPGLGIHYVSQLSTPENQIQNDAPKDPHFLRQVNHPLVLPINEKIRILVTSQDVLHSWWVPAFGIKQTAVPGFLRSTWVKIDKPGIYRGQCATLCGVGHAFMPIVVVAKTHAGFLRWVANEQAAQAQKVAETTVRAKAIMTKAELMAKGRQVFGANCTACHGVTGLGMPGTFPPIATGRVFAAAPEMTRKLLALGFYQNGKIVEGPIKNHIDIVLYGVPGTAMPAWGSQLSNVAIAAVVTYERNAFGNHTGDVVQPGQIAAIRVTH